MASLQNRQLADVTNQAPGYTTRAYISLMSAFALVAAAETADGDQFKVTDDHTFPEEPEGLGFFEIYTLPRKTTVASESVGETGANTMMHRATLFFPGDGPDVMALIQKLKNEELMVIMEDANEPGGPMVQLGTKKTPAWFNSAPVFESGTQLDGMKGYTVEIISAAKLYYSGTLTIAA